MVQRDTHGVQYDRDAAEARRTCHSVGGDGCFGAKSCRAERMLCATEQERRSIESERGCCFYFKVEEKEVTAAAKRHKPYSHLAASMNAAVCLGAHTHIHFFGAKKVSQPEPRVVFARAIFAPARVCEQNRDKLLRPHCYRLCEETMRPREHRCCAFWAHNAHTLLPLSLYVSKKLSPEILQAGFQKKNYEKSARRRGLACTRRRRVSHSAVNARESAPSW